ncbi:hypothetical protein G5C51_06520 [Streptomyces sp. A7024]|uniref:Uncharacterized protein n=1 Tax=Streptomyces coryli TaxID=1128680 RepID=A0A6G4TU60_9ACTN|nr:GTPase-associated protein 1-related protein [Streptomyces coryli]NGN63559.1 hypothetical protein [Streptomyces coryli]
MAVEQLYYTSCEQGLSGFSGFQFNAVSSGVRADVMHAVEALAGYEPPRSMLNSDSPEDLARCPVNLCFVPESGDDEKGATVLCARYVGRDSAQRFGNYFAHALHTSDFDRDGDGLLGIELWGSPEWTASPVAENEIPPLPGPPRPGPLTPEAADEFVAAEPHAAAQLPHLLAAAFSALHERRTVVVVDSTTERIAHWFAAVCYLLPPPLARRLSFATYAHKPGRSRLHLIGAVPGTRIDIGPDDHDVYRVFDFAAGHFPPDGEIPVHHLVRLLLRVGVRQASAVWSWTDAYTSGEERYQGDWHAPFAAAAATGGMELRPADVRAVALWAPEAAHAGELRAEAARDIYLRYPDLDDEELAGLSRAAADGGDAELHQEIEGRLYASRMRAAMHGTAPGAPPPVRLADPVLRERAAADWTELLREADDQQAVRLHLWALDSRLPVPQGYAWPALERLARSLLEATATRSAPDGHRGEVRRLFHASPDFRSALADAVGDLLGQRPGQQGVLLQFPGDLLGEGDLAGRPELLRHYWVAQTERRPDRAVEHLLRILRLTGAATPDAELLRDLWPYRRWTVTEAIAFVRRLHPDAVIGPAAVEWLEAALQKEPQTEDELRPSLELCELLTDPRRIAWLSTQAVSCVAAVEQLNGLLNGTATAQQLADGFTAVKTDRWGPARALVHLRLPGALMARPVDPREVRTFLARFPDRTVVSYLKQLLAATRSGKRATPAVLDHVTGLELILKRYRTGLPLLYQDYVAAICEHAEQEWDVRDTELLAAALRPHHGPSAQRVNAIAAERLGAARKLARRLRGKGDRRDQGEGGK